MNYRIEMHNKDYKKILRNDIKNTDKNMNYTEMLKN
jgi:hypothetical protein